MELTPELRAELHELLRSDGLAAHNVLFAIDCGVMTSIGFRDLRGRCCLMGATMSDEAYKRHRSSLPSHRASPLERWFMWDCCDKNATGRLIRSEVIAWLAEQGQHPEPSPRNLTERPELVYALAHPEKAMVAA